MASPRVQEFGVAECNCQSNRIDFNKWKGEIPGPSHLAMAFKGSRVQGLKASAFPLNPGTLEPLNLRTQAARLNAMALGKF
jgi:hypothetical protein